MPERLNNVVGFSVERVAIYDAIRNVFPTNNTVVFTQGVNTYTWVIPNGLWTNDSIYFYINFLNAASSPPIAGLAINFHSYSSVTIRATSSVTLKLSDPAFTLKAPFFSTGSTTDLSGTFIQIDTEEPSIPYATINFNSSNLTAGSLKNQFANIFLSNPLNKQFKNYISVVSISQTSPFSGLITNIQSDTPRSVPDNLYDKPRTIQEFDIYITNSDGTEIEPGYYNQATGYYQLIITFFMNN